VIVTITVTEMALSGYEKQKRWREKNRALYNFHQRQRRKTLSGMEKVTTNSPAVGVRTEVSGVSVVGDRAQNQSSPPAQKSKIEELRELIKTEHERVVEAPTMPATKPLIFRNDYGAVISERAWNQLQEKKNKAKEGGYELDEYSQ
jgi:ABC-type phosphonate transport system ATPase subunit